jgi:hypothetical protein
MPGSQSVRQTKKPEVLDFKYRNKAWMNVRRWQTARFGAVDKGRSIQFLGRTDQLGPLIADAYTELTLRKYTRFELSVALACVSVAAISGIAAIYDPILLVLTIVSAWFASIAIRFYRHHLKCYWYVRTLNSQTCPFCGRSLVPMPTDAELVMLYNH